MTDLKGPDRADRRAGAQAPAAPPLAEGSLPAPTTELEFLNRYVKGNPLLSREASAFISRLLLEMEQLPWKNREQIRCVFENTDGDVQICFPSQHLHFSPARELFIRKHIEPLPVTPATRDLLSEWVRCESKGLWDKPDCGALSIAIRNCQADVSVTFSITEKKLVDSEGDLEETKKTRMYTATRGMSFISTEGKVEQALAEGTKEVVLLFPKREPEREELKWIERLAKLFRGRNITVLVGDQPELSQNKPGVSVFKFFSFGLRQR